MKESLNIVFMGTPEFAVTSLDKINNSTHSIVGVITAPDKPAGRGKKLHASAVKKYALVNEIPLLQPTNLKNDEFINELRALNADLFVVVAFRMLPEKVWSMPSKGTINLHGSLLPDYRGAAPINWAVINGDKFTGVSTFFIQQKIDTGNIIQQETIPIAVSDTAGDLHDRMMEVGANTLLETLDLISTGDLEVKEQEWNQSYRKAPKIFKEDCAINWSDSSDTIYHKIRGLSPYPTAFTKLIDESGQVKGLKIFFAEIEESLKLEPGEIKFEDKKHLYIGTSDSALTIKDLQLEGKKRLKIVDFLRGFQTEKTWKAQ